MELIFEIIFEVYVELMMLIIPEEKATSRKCRVLTILLALLVLICVFALFIWGCVLISDHNNHFGCAPIAIAIVISVAQIIAGLRLHNKKAKNDV